MTARQAKHPKPHLFYYYGRDSFNAPRITFCFAVSPDGNHYARGIARCSVLDNPCKAEGRRIARSRALGAYYGEVNVSTPWMAKARVMPAPGALEERFLEMVRREAVEAA